MISHHAVAPQLNIHDVAVCRPQHLQQLSLLFAQQLFYRHRSWRPVVQHHVVAEETEHPLGQFPVHLTGT